MRIGKYRITLDKERVKENIIAISGIVILGAGFSLLVALSI